ncbi:hypothetical protein PybrP1_012046 [[Pythium] brassicae (nom. inval.)]|nr:hypothetical protein PybrP1_012046 [[Pythium] brassicae (nom. inval.)]
MCIYRTLYYPAQASGPLGRCEALRRGHAQLRRPATKARCSLEGDIADIPDTFIPPGDNFEVATLASEDEMIANAAGDGSWADCPRRARTGALASRVLVSHLEQGAKANWFASVSPNVVTGMCGAVYFTKIGSIVAETQRTHYYTTSTPVRLDDEAFRCTSPSMSAAALQ